MFTQSIVVSIIGHPDSSCTFINVTFCNLNKIIKKGAADPLASPLLSSVQALERLFTREEDMKVILRFILPLSGLVAVLIFGVSATASISNAADVVNTTISEPVSMLIIGVGLIGFGSYIKRRSLRS